MNLISVEELSKDYGERVLFENLSFGLSRGDKMALIANNGTGKSSLLKIITGKDVFSAGKVTFRKGIEVGYLSQNSDFDESLTIQQLVDSAQSRVSKIIAEYEKAVVNQTNDFSEKNQNTVEELTLLMDQYSAWDYDRRIKQILSKFKITDLSHKVAKLSGGQKKRLSLSLLLIDESDVLLLDEPTNHLDVEMIEWLEKYLSQQKITLLMVTHDRYFLENVCNHILELENGELYHHKGNYSYFLEKREERENNFSVEIEKAGKLMKKELEWVRRSPKARTTKSKSRLQSFEKIKEKANSGRKKSELKLEVKMSRVGGKILELKNIHKSYGDICILDGFTYTFKKGERIGILGGNGVGKSTLLNILTGKEKADSGKVNVGETIVYGYFSQGGIEIKEDKRVIEVLKDIADVIILANGSKISASQMLEHFMFTPDMQYTYVSKLSGGEKRRLYLLTVLMKNPNFLILDEPTNDMDLLTLTKLEEFLLEFKGCLIIVSHDRYFMDKLTDHIFVFKGGGVIDDFYGNYSDFREKKKEEEKELKSVKKEKYSPVKAEEKRKVSYKEKYEYEQLEKEIAILEKEKEELESSLLNPNLDVEIIIENSKILSDIVNIIDKKSSRWLELDELM
ncbi:MAG: ABC transporter [Flavobacteriales bacterium]|nr:ABC transporter [Flavobacteriales bacterium]MAX69411.1 ABC transporter [Flavobacteriales bacterium]|tara:strand:+ start:1626 stop:3497 length:1872 start_codon:yes stop_codon:yes gene_type:complete